MRLHHIGHVVKDLERARMVFENLFGLKSIGEPVIDPLQEVEVLFLSTGEKTDPLIELITPVSRSSPVSRFLDHGEGLHHLCFEVDSVGKTTEKLREKGVIVLGRPIPGKGHGGKLTSWIYTPSRQLIELVEK